MTQPQVGDLVGRYRLDAVLGEGGMGVVYAATDPHLRRRVALKVMSGALAASGEFRRRFAREADALSRLSSPHVIAILDHGEHPAGGGGAPYLVTQLVGGGELGRLLRERGALPTHLAAAVCAQIAEALRDAHAAGVVHRDVKPSNVLLHDADAVAAGGQLHAYLCDFGIAQTRSEAAGEDTALTVPGGVAGTWSYLAPERLRGLPATAASDTYAVGCLLWACLVGRAPYAGSDAEIAAAHLHAPPPRLAGDDQVSRRVNDLLVRTMAKDPAARPDDADLVRRLRELAALPAVGVTPDAASRTEGPRPSRRTPLLVGGAVLVLLAAAVTLGVVLRDPDQRAATVTDTRPSVDATDAAGASGPVTGDLDGDGLGDVAVRWTDADGAPRLATWSSDGEALTGPEPGDEPGPGGVLVRGDVDGDDVDELLRVTGQESGGDLDVLDLTAGTRRTVERAGFLLRPVAADVDGDGHDDLVLVEPTERGGVEVRVATRNAADDFTSADAWATGDWDPTVSEVQAGDLDGDGRDDLVVVRRAADAGTPNGDATAQLLGSDGSSFTAVGEPTTLADEGEGVVRLADVDGDDVAELVVVPRTYAGPVRVLGWDGEDFSAPATWADLPGLDDRLYVESVGTTDLDGDGADDLVVARRVGDDETYGVAVLRSTGDGFADERVLAELAGDGVDPVASVVGSSVEDPLFG